jgi:hypothetical protein
MLRATTCMRQSSGEQLYLCDTRYLLFCVDVLYAGWNSTMHTRQSSIQNNKYQVSHKYSCFSWCMAHSRSKHVEKRNKHTNKNCAPSWLYLQDYTAMHGQQNIKLNFSSHGGVFRKFMSAISWRMWALYRNRCVLFQSKRYEFGLTKSVDVISCTVCAFQRKRC